ncbi:MAG: DMT family transporter [Pseudomonadota bacterium]|nr:DMT family transporter [Pseudomonadota bacterium]
MTAVDQGAAPGGAGRVSGLGFGVLIGLVTASIWAGYLVLVRQGMTSGFQPVDMAAARFWPAGLILLPVLLRHGIRDLAGIGWGRGLVLTLFAGPPFALLMSYGLKFTPVSHGGVIAPSTLTLTTTLLTVIFLGERLSRFRVLGLVLIVTGLVLVAGTGFLNSFNPDVLMGDLLVIAAPSCWAVFTLLLRVWQIDAVRGTAAVSVIGSIVLIPLHLAFADYAHLATVDPWEIARQFFGQGVLNGFLATMLFAVTVSRIGPARAGVFPSLVPALTIMIGAPLLGEYPAIWQIAGMLVVTAGLVFAVGLVDHWRSGRSPVPGG